MKFAAVGYPMSLDDAFWHWADIVFGGIGLSSLAAVRHFLSPAFPEAAGVAEAQAAIARTFCQRATANVRAAEWSEATTGIFGSFLLPRLPPDLADRPDELQRVLEATGTSFIPGTRNQVPREVGFSFRVNVARDGPQFRGAVSRLLAYLDHLGG
jgi:hypothetical protein